MNAKKIIIVVAMLAAAAAGLYAWKEFNRKNKDLSQVQAEHTMQAPALINEFAENDSAANARYQGKIIAVQGMVKQVEKDDEGFYTVVLGDTTVMSAVRCAIDSTQAAGAAVLQRGQTTTIKGALTGYKKDDTGLLGSDVELNRCVIEKNK